MMTMLLVGSMLCVAAVLAVAVAGWRVWRVRPEDRAKWAKWDQHEQGGGTEARCGVCGAEAPPSADGCAVCGGPTTVVHRPS